MRPGPFIKPNNKPPPIDMNMITDSDRHTPVMCAGSHRNVIGLFVTNNLQEQLKNTHIQNVIYKTIYINVEKLRGKKI